MKCDLCNREKNGQGLLCESCGDMIQRLLTIQQKASASKTCEAARLANAKPENALAASNWAE
jgi:hypothetical protein